MSVNQLSCIYSLLDQQNDNRSISSRIKIFESQFINLQYIYSGTLRILPRKQKNIQMSFDFLRGRKKHAKHPIL